MAMATLSQLHVARGWTGALQLRRNGAVSRNSPISSPVIDGGVPRLRVLSCSRRGALAHVKSENVTAGAREERESSLPLKGVGTGILGAAGGFLEAAGPAHAFVREEVEETMRFSPEEWVNIYIGTGVWVVLYFIVIPLVVYNYLRLRWYKRTFLETYFQFMLVFVFFPGMLLLAPFINFRRLPADGAEEP